MKRFTHFFILALVLMPFQSAFADGSADLGFTAGNLFVGSKSPVTSKPVRIYATVNNNGTEDSLGSVRFYNANTGAQIGSDQAISLVAERADDVFIDYNAPYGTNTVKAEIIPWDGSTDDPSNNVLTVTFFVDIDTDNDGIGNRDDIDDDNDGVADINDVFPLDASESVDTDGDGIGNNADNDDDNDDVLDSDDAFPLDPNESVDTDEDGIGNNADDDDDNDGVNDLDEDVNANQIVDEGETDPLVADTDGDSVNDSEDAFPLNPNETTDFDNDGIGDNEDTDDDNDNIDDSIDVNSNNQGPVIEAGNVSRTSNVSNTVIIDSTDSFDPDGEITNTVIVISTSGSIEDLDSFEEFSNDTQGSNSTDKDDTSTESGTSESGTTDSSNSEGESGSVSGLVDEDGNINLNSIEELVSMYFDNVDEMVRITDENINDLVIEDGKTYLYSGTTLPAVFKNPGNYVITLIAQDDKNETRTKEITVKVRNYSKIFINVLIILIIVLAIAGAIKYILRAQNQDAPLGKAKKGEKGPQTKSKK